jgi:hypothetical protein
MLKKKKKERNSQIGHGNRWKERGEREERRGEERRAEEKIDEDLSCNRGLYIQRLESNRGMLATQGGQNQLNLNEMGAKEGQPFWWNEGPSVELI